MKYITLEFQKNAEGVIATISLAHDSEQAALAQFFTVMHAATSSNLLVHGCSIMNEYGAPMRYEYISNEQQPEAGE